MAITKSKVQQLREDMNKALAAVGKKHGVTITAGNARFDDLSVTFKTEAKVNSVAGGKPVAQAEFERNARLVGLDPKDFGRVFIGASGVKFTVSGVKPRNRKYPVIATNARGVAYKFPVSAILGK